MQDYRQYSYWLESCGDDITPRPPLDGSLHTDVAILGAGFTGLWTAYYLQQRDPALQIVLLDRDIAGFGASGRNGGWCSAGFPVSLGELERRFGHEAARQLHLAMIHSVDEVGAVAASEQLDCDYEKGGVLRLARGPQQLPLLQQALATYHKLGFTDDYQFLGEAETRQRLRVTKALAALFSPHCATIHPGKLVRALARCIEQRGATIYEQTPVTGYTPGRRPCLHTLHGEVRASVIVLAGEAYLARLAQLARQLIPIYSLIVLTEPLSAEQWDAIGWAGRECVSSSKYVVDYLSKTIDGRILFGGRGAPYHFDSTIKDAYDRHQPTHHGLREATREWFPVVRPEQFSHAWGGPLGVPRDWMPTMSYNRKTGIATARGYTGQGVSTTNLSGRVLADLISGQASALTTLPMVNQRSPNWEHEPWRYLGVRYVQRAYVRLDRGAERHGVPPDGASLAERLSRH